MTDPHILATRIATPTLQPVPQPVFRLVHRLQANSRRWKWVVIVIAMYFGHSRREDAHR